MSLTSLPIAGLSDIVLGIHCHAIHERASLVTECSTAGPTVEIYGQSQYTGSAQRVLNAISTFEVASSYNYCTGSILYIK
jgi:hypothetical protein